MSGETGRIGEPEASRPTATAGWRGVAAAAVLSGIALLGTVAGAVPAAAQETEAAEREVPVDTAALASGAYATMEMLYERTFLGIDVMRLTLRFGEETAARLEELAAGRRHSDELADSVAAAALESRNVMVRSRFVRDVSFDQFIDGVEKNMEAARKAGLLSPEEFDRIWADIPSDYSPLRDRGIRDGEAMYYRIRGDTLHVRFQALDGSILVHRSPVGPERRMAVLGGYLAPDSDFREKLVKSLFEEE